MKTGVSALLLAHLAQPYQTTATCWKVTRRDGQIFGYTDHDQNIVFGTGSPTIEHTYLAASGYTATNIESTDALNVDNLEVQGMLVDDSITENDLRAGLWDYARVEIFTVNYADLTMGRMIQRVGTLGEVRMGRERFEAELRGLTQAFTRSIGELTSPGCRASLGDERCQVDLGPFTVTGTVDSVHADNMTIFDSTRTEPGPGQEAGSPVANTIGQVSAISGLQAGSITGHSLFVTVSPLTTMINGSAVGIYGMTGINLSMNGIWIVTGVTHSSGQTSVGFQIPNPAPFGFQPNPAGTIILLGISSGYFDYGVLTWTSGDNLDLSMEVKNYVPGVITLALPMPYAIQAGDAYSMHAGCDKALETCRDRFNNIVNMRAEPYLPGIDKVVQVARRQ